MTTSNTQVVSERSGPGPVDPVSDADPDIRRKMVHQKTLSLIAQSVGVGIVVSQVILAGLGISRDLWTWLFAACGFALAVIGYIGLAEWQSYAKARLGAIKSRAKARSPDGSKVLYLTEDELAEMAELHAIKEKPSD